MTAGKTSSLNHWAVAVSAASFFVTLPHVFEDFVYGVPQRFGLSVMAAGFLVATGYFVHVIGMLLALKGKQEGLIILLLIGFGWASGAILDHLPDVLQSGPFRQGAVSKVMVILIILTGLILMFLSAAAIRQLRKKNS